MAEETLTNVAKADYNFKTLSFTASAKSVLKKFSNILKFEKTQIPTVGQTGDIVEFTLTANASENITDLVVTDDLNVAGYIFVAGSVTIDGIPNLAADPTVGIPLGNLNVGDTKVVVFSATIN